MVSSPTTFLIYIEDMTNGVPNGRVLCTNCVRPFDFYGFADLCLKVEAVCDYLGVPDRDGELRKARENDRAIEDMQRELVENSGLKRGMDDGFAWLDNQSYRRMIYSFTLRVLFRQRWSWQGVLQGSDEEQLCFRSALEFINMAACLTASAWAKRDAIKPMDVI